MCKHLVASGLMAALIAATVWAPTGAIAAGPTELLGDPGFEEGSPNPFWQEQGVQASTYPLITDEDPGTGQHAGTYGVWLCGYFDCDDRVWQEVAVPQDIESATLTYWYRIATEETLFCADSMSIGLEDSEGAAGPRTTYCNQAANSSWTPGALDVTVFLQAHEGQEIATSAVAQGDGSLNTNFLLDDVSLQVTTSDPVTPRPDGMIRKSTESSFAGNNIYNSTGTGQTKKASGRRRSSKIFIVKIQNDADVMDSFVVKGAGSSLGFKVAYFKGTTLITAAVVGGSFKLRDVAPGATRSIKMKITATRKAKYGTTKKVPITARSLAATTQSDTVKAAMKAVRR